MLSELLSLVAQGHATTRADIARFTGLARSTVSQRVDTLVARQLLLDDGAGASTGGRPAQQLRLNATAGVILAADVGASHYRAAVCDITGTILAETAGDLDIGSGPERVLGHLDAAFNSLLEDVRRSRSNVYGVGIGVPGPVEFSTGTVIRPPIMPGWDGYRVPSYFTELYDAPVLVDNDVNILALGEYWTRRPETDSLLFIKVGTGIGCGIVEHGLLHRGADGAAGDIGHIQLPDHEDTICRCGNTGCVEAVASGEAIANRLRAGGLEVRTSRDVVRLALAGDPAARRAVRVASQQIGDVLAGIVSFYNPKLIVVGGTLAALHQELLAGIRSVIYHRALPLATRSIRIEASRIGDRAGVIGTLALARDHVLSPIGLERLLSNGSPAGAE